MAEEYLGQAIANGGGLGISKMIVQGLERGSATSSSSAQRPATPLQTRTDSAR
jgi:Rod binding domain-containing protein